MDRGRKLIAAAAPSLVAIALAVNAGAAAGAVVAAATGGYHVTYGGQERSVTFAAQRDDTNTSTGQAELFNHVTGTRLHFTVDCLSVAGNVATLSGTVTRTDTGTFPLGEPFWLQVADNGEGGNKPRDLVSPLFVMVGGPVIPCTAPIVPAALPIDGGNVQVR